MVHITGQVLAKEHEKTSYNTRNVVVSTRW